MGPTPLYTTSTVHENGHTTAVHSTTMSQTSESTNPSTGTSPNYRPSEYTSTETSSSSYSNTMSTHLSTEASKSTSSALTTIDSTEATVSTSNKQMESSSIEAKTTSPTTVTGKSFTSPTDYKVNNTESPIPREIAIETNKTASTTDGFESSSSEIGDMHTMSTTDSEKRNDKISTLHSKMTSTEPGNTVSLTATFSISSTKERQTVTSTEALVNTEKSTHISSTIQNNDSDIEVTQSTTRNDEPYIIDTVSSNLITTDSQLSTEIENQNTESSAIPTVSIVETSNMEIKTTTESSNTPTEEYITSAVPKLISSTGKGYDDIPSSTFTTKIDKPTNSHHSSSPMVETDKINTIQSTESMIESSRTTSEPTSHSTKFTDKTYSTDSSNIDKITLSTNESTNDKELQTTISNTTSSISNDSSSPSASLTPTVVSLQSRHESSGKISTLPTSNLSSTTPKAISLLSTESHTFDISTDSSTPSHQSFSANSLSYQTSETYPSAHISRDNSITPENVYPDSNSDTSLHSDPNTFSESSTHPFSHLGTTNQLSSNHPPLKTTTYSKAVSEELTTPHMHELSPSKSESFISESQGTMLKSESPLSISATTRSISPLSATDDSDEQSASLKYITSTDTPHISHSMKSHSLLSTMQIDTAPTNSNKESVDSENTESTSQKTDPTKWTDKPLLSTDIPNHSRIQSTVRIESTSAIIQPFTNEIVKDLTWSSDSETMSNNENPITSDAHGSETFTTNNEKLIPVTTSNLKEIMSTSSSSLSSLSSSITSPSLFQSQTYSVPTSTQSAPKITDLLHISHSTSSVSSNITLQSTVQNTASTTSSLHTLQTNKLASKTPITREIDEITPQTENISTLSFMSDNADTASQTAATWKDETTQPTSGNASSTTNAYGKFPHCESN